MLERSSPSVLPKQLRSVGNIALTGLDLILRDQDLIEGNLREEPRATEKRLCKRVCAACLRCAYPDVCVPEGGALRCRYESANASIGPARSHLLSRTGSLRQRPQPKTSLRCLRWSHGCQVCADVCFLFVLQHICGFYRWHLNCIAHSLSHWVSAFICMLRDWHASLAPCVSHPLSTACRQLPFLRPAVKTTRPANPAQAAPAPAPAPAASVPASAPTSTGFAPVVAPDASSVMASPKNFSALPSVVSWVRASERYGW